MPDDYIDHPNIREESLESRTYQEVIAAEARQENTICVLPTGLGKTAVGILLAAHRIEEQPGSKILVLAPTKPLTEQHRESFRDALKIDTDIYEVMTGDTRPAKREDLWKEIGAFFATPQVVENDIISGRVDLDDFSLIVFDECHRATGDYPYSFIAEKYMQQADNPLILGLTASPGGDRERIEQVAENLYIENFEVRTEDDPDVKPYVQRKNVNWLKVSLDQNFKRCKQHLDQAKRTRVKKLKQKGFLDSSSANRGDLLKLRKKIQSRLSSEDDPELYQAISLVAACMKVDHALELLETQGIEPLYDFLQNMKKDPGSKAAKRLLEDEDFQNAIAVTEWMYRNQKRHPKLKRLEKLLKQKVSSGDTAIVFTQYRDTVDVITSRIAEIPHIEPERFKGQKEDFTQQQQLEILDSFRNDEFNVLVSTSVGEEGLDIPAVDYVIFYEPVPSEIRTIQRRGRTGRQEAGRIYVLMAENTRDEGYYWSAHNKEKQMKAVLKELKDHSQDVVSSDQQTLDSFSQEEELVLIADDRENTLAKELSRQDVVVRTKRLELADFLVSDRTAVERKTTKDFVDSIVDQRLFTQVKELREQFERPILLIEGDDLFGHRDVHPNAVRGALSSVALDYDMPILWSSDETDTAKTLIALARREQEEQDREVRIRGERTPTSETDLQKFIVAGLPNISDKLAERLLDEFGSVRSVFQASETELTNVEGIGEGKAERIAEILDMEYKR
ncbi:MAG: DEAD/DEAH box helicase [Candidatus Nanohaloarchaea archaeon]|nr:DEAD/DEAH box helicase [Candidatus Nanohaloarchaea archaeon]